jgi:hypothetical protein
MVITCCTLLGRIFPVPNIVVLIQTWSWSTDSHPTKCPDIRQLFVSEFKVPTLDQLQSTTPIDKLTMNGLLIACSARHHIPHLPDSLKPYLILLDDPVGLPVCRACQAALLPKSVLDHLRKHHQLPEGLRGTVRSMVATLPSLDFDDVPKNPDDSAPLEALRVVDAFQCKHCPFIRRDLTDVRKHIDQEHNLSAAGSYTKMQAQSFFGGRRAVYWRFCVVPKTRILREEPPCWGFMGKASGTDVRQPGTGRK